MVPYRPVAYRPSASSPRIGQYGQKRSIGQPFEGYLGFSPTMGDIIRLIFHGGATYLGIYVGVEKTGLLSALGWFIGAGHAIGAVLDIVSLVQRAAGTHPPESTRTAQPPA